MPLNEADTCRRFVVPKLLGMTRIGPPAPLARWLRAPLREVETAYRRAIDLLPEEPRFVRELGRILASRGLLPRNERCGRTLLGPQNKILSDNCESKFKNIMKISL